MEFFHRQLVPWVRYVPVRADLADLVQAVRSARCRVCVCMEYTAIYVTSTQYRPGLTGPYCGGNVEVM